MGRRELANAAIDGPRRGDELALQVKLQSFRVHPVIDARMARKRMQFGAKSQARFRHSVIERLLAHPVAGQKKPLALFVPDSKSEHAAQKLQAIDAMSFVERKDDLGVGVGVKHVARRYEFFAQFLKVVNLAVEDDGVSGDDVEHRLMAGGAEIDDAQSHMTKDANAFWRRPKAAIIGPAVADAGDHRVHRLPARMGPPVQGAGYAAHRFATKILYPLLKAASSFRHRYSMARAHQSGAVIQTEMAATTIPKGSFISKLMVAVACHGWIITTPAAKISAILIPRRLQLRHKGNLVWAVERIPTDIRAKPML